MSAPHRLFTLVALLIAFSASLAPAGAVAADEIVEEVFTQGFFVEDGATITAAEASAIVDSAREQGSRYHLVVLVETPPGGNTVFAETLFDFMGIDEGTVLVLSEDDVGWFSTEFTPQEMEQAFLAANDAGGSDAAYAANFTGALFGLDLNVGSTADSGGGGGSSGLLWVFLIIGAIVLFVWWMMRRSKQRATQASAQQLAAARAEIQTQLDGVANDILDMEDEVRRADNPKVDALFDEAGRTYNQASDEIAVAASPQELLDLSNKVDVAVWQLDSVEAILDGKEAPPKPEPKRLELPPAPQPTQPSRPVPGGSESGSSLPPRPSYPKYQRRSTRRSSGMSPGMLEILMGLGAGAMAGRRSRRPSRSRRTSSSSSRSSGSSGGVVPGPSSRRRSSTSRRSRSTGRRTRGGGKRKR